MKLEILDESRRQDYNRFAARQGGGNFLQAWEWGQWQESLGRQASRYFLAAADGRPQAAIQLLHMALPGGRFYLYAPYGPVAAGDFAGPAAAFLIESLRRRFPRALFLRLEPQVPWPELPKQARKSANIQPAITMQVALERETEELLGAMHPKTRYNIKLAQRHGVTVQSEPAVTPGHGLYVQELIDLIVQTQARQNYRGHPAAYYRRLIDFFALNGTAEAPRLRLYKALWQRQLLACGVMVDFGPTRVYLYGGSAAEQRQLMAPYLLHWQAMLDARLAGLSCYDLGGSEVSLGGERGFTRFKRGFGGTVVNFAGAYDAIFSPGWYRLYNLLRSANRLIKFF